ncbi:unnamed protein product [Rotaria sp. Silwood2]|nr:unnamed protein product [Rotaria sp. Silwood2]CAF2846598.1 unnamed protein product [Rotaria sp. Silwood2]CAF3071999.1 unnamed protein product [Rotaria sp. Silwood2]CAF3263582.1 unnamed protein product [Rotaria sp. Silwood2]CAF4196213.1 unnamed protein product [Rotaria sp. Silwood2]
MSINNFNNTLDSRTQFRSETADIIQIPLFILIIIFAFVYIILVLSRKILRSNKFTWLTINTSVSSILFSFEHLLSIIMFLNNSPDIKVSCRLKAFFMHMSAHHVMYAHCIASFCRLLSIQYLHNPLFRSSRWILGNIIVGWLVGLLATFPYLFFDDTACLVHDGEKFLEIYACFSIIVLPITIVTVCNIATIRYVRLSTKRIHNLTGNNINQLGKREMYLFKTMLLTFCIYIIGAAPFFIERVFVNNELYLPPVLSTIFQVLQAISLLADVILLIYSDQLVRNIIIKTLQYNGKFLFIFTF